MSVFEELKRRNVFRVGIAYAVSAWVLLQVLDVVGAILELPVWGGRVILVLLVVGFFITLFVAWAYELTPEGLKRESEVDRSRSITPHTGRRLNALILALMALAIAYLLADKFLLAPQLAQRDTAVVPAGPPVPAEATAERKSIAVLPFANRSDRPDDQFFTDGIHDDLLSSLARIGSLKVISRTSVMEYRGTTKKIPEIAAELGVANVLEGGIQRSGKQVRINVQLIGAKTDEHLWAETYDRELTADNLFAIQSEIASRITEALQATLSPDEAQRLNRMPTRSLEAYDAYLRGRQLMATRVTANLKQSAEEFGRAVELDPDFALAWVGLADSNYLYALRSDAGVAASLALREDAVGRALALDPGLGEAYASLAQIQSDRERFDEMEQTFRKAIELSPNYATAYHWYANSLVQDPLRSRQRLDLLLRAAELDPRSMIIGTALAGEYFHQGLFSRGEQQARKMIDLYPDFPNVHHVLVDHYLEETGEFARALQEARVLSQIDPGDFNAWRHQIEIYLAVGDLQAAAAVQERIVEMDPNSYWAGWLDFLNALGQGDAPAIRESGNWVLRHAPADHWTISTVAQAMLIAGDAGRARELLLQAEPGWQDPEQWPHLIRKSPGQACILSWMLLSTGEAEPGQALLQQATTYLEHTLPAAIEHADRYQPEICFLTAGDTEKALDSLETQLAHGHIWSWRADHRMPMYAEMRHDPRYRELLAGRDQRIAEQRMLIDEENLNFGSE